MQICQELRFILLSVLNINVWLAACSGGPSPNIDRIDACSEQILKVGSTLLMSPKEGHSETYCIEIIDQTRCLSRMLGLPSRSGIQNFTCQLGQDDSLKLEIAGEELLLERQDQKCSDRAQWKAPGWIMVPGETACRDSGSIDQSRMEN